MSGAVGNDEFAAWGGEVPVGYINGYSLFPFRSKAVQQQGVINFTCSSSSIFSLALRSSASWSSKISLLS